MGGMMKKQSWVVVANSSLARLFHLENLKLHEMDSLVHSKSRMHGMELTSDRSGQNREGVGYGNAALSKQMTPKKHEAVVFAKEVAEHLNAARSRGQIERLFIAANPSFLGLIRQELNHQTAEMVSAEVDKDITHLDPQKILEYFPIGL